MKKYLILLFVIGCTTKSPVQKEPVIVDITELRGMTLTELSVLDMMYRTTSNRKYWASNLQTRVSNVPAGEERERVQEQIINLLRYTSPDDIEYTRQCSEYYRKVIHGKIKHTNKVQSGY